MTPTPDLAEATARDLLAEKFPRWTIWRSDTERWWATRHAPLSRAEEQQPGIDRTIDADTPADLCRQLTEQAALTDKCSGSTT
ncbi:hypothetical protein [Streptosporangium sp. NPDC006930]|uniref:hypothetical protein n=1 Tax=Streptosporangium sp. NPDC006930 TaxID=3154783 RepID=UPI00341FAE2A